MRASTIGLLATTWVAGVICQKVVRYDFKGRSPADVVQLAKRNTIKEYILNDVNGSLYSVNVSIGTPGQIFQLQLDTGSTDIWVNSGDSRYCRRGNCLDSFDSSGSSTYQNAAAGAFGVSYGDGTSASGDFFTDVISIGGISVKNQTIGLASDSDIPQGLLGVGMVGTEGSCASAENQFCYPNLIDTMVNQGLISSHAFSLYLNDLNESTGSILFGGVDSARYTGELVSIPMVGIPLSNGSFDETRYTVAWTDVTITTPNGVEQVANGGVNIPVLLDSGTTLAVLPTSVTRSLYEQMGALEIDGVGFAPCYLRTADATIDFHLGGSDGVTLAVPLRQLLLDVDSSYADFWRELGVPDYCQVGFYSGDDQAIFGDSILRSSYIVYDLTNRQIAIAPANFDPGNKQNIQEITSGTTSNIPGVSRTASAVSSLSTVTDTANGPIHHHTATAAASDSSYITGVPTVPLASFTTASYTGQDGYTAFDSITTTAPTGTGAAASSSSAGVANSVHVPTIGFERFIIAGLVSLFVTFGGGMLLL